jgi:hypothetical protein
MSGNIAGLGFVRAMRFGPFPGQIHALACVAGRLC